MKRNGKVTSMLKKVTFCQEREIYCAIISTRINSESIERRIHK